MCNSTRTALLIFILTIGVPYKILFRENKQSHNLLIYIYTTNWKVVCVPLNLSQGRKNGMVSGTIYLPLILIPLLRMKEARSMAIGLVLEGKWDLLPLPVSCDFSEIHKELWKSASLLYQEVKHFWVDDAKLLELHWHIYTIHEYHIQSLIYTTYLRRTPPEFTMKRDPMVWNVTFSKL